MKTLRSKEEIQEDIEQSRRSLRSAFRQTKETVVERNPAILAFQFTKQKFFAAKNRALVKKWKTNNYVLGHLYQTIGIALGVGIVAGLIAYRRKARLD